MAQHPLGARGESIGHQKRGTVNAVHRGPGGPPTGMSTSPVTRVLAPHGTGLATLLPWAGGVGWPCPHAGVPVPHAVPKLLFTPPRWGFHEHLSTPGGAGRGGSNPATGQLGLGALRAAMLLPMGFLGGNGNQTPNSFSSSCFSRIFLPPAWVTLAADTADGQGEPVYKGALKMTGFLTHF